jgi:hypothetical protein
MIDFIIGIAFCIVFGLVATGIVLQNRDEQQLWEARKDYTRMQKEVEKNESSRGI